MVLKQEPEKEQVLGRIQALQDELYDLYRSLNQDTDPQAFNAGLLAWESVRLFWYSVRGNKDGIEEKYGYVLEALIRFEKWEEANCCPNCGSAYIGVVDWPKDKPVEVMKCDSCGHSWDEAVA